MEENKQNQFWQTASLVGIVLCLFLVVQIIGGLKGLRYIGNEAVPQNVINVSGEGEVFIVPDIATFTWSVNAIGANVKAAQDKATVTVDKAITALKALGIDDKDIKTVDFSAYPKYEYMEIRCITYPCTPGKNELVGYEVNQTVMVKVRNVDGAGDAIDAATSAGATNVSGLTFTVDDEDAATRDARKMAIEDAQTKAKELARDLGVRLVRIVSFSENGGYPVPFYGRAEAALSVGGADMVKAPSLPTGENKITSNVSITYEIR